MIKSYSREITRNNLKNLGRQKISIKNKLIKALRFILDPSNAYNMCSVKYNLSYIFRRQIRNGAIRVKQKHACSISWNILPTFTLHLFVLEWPELELIPFLFTLRFASSSGFARLVSRVARSLFIFSALLLSFPPFCRRFVSSFHTPFSFQ